MSYLEKLLAKMDIRQFMGSKSISDSRSVETIRTKDFRSEFCSTSTN